MVEVLLGEQLPPAITGKELSDKLTTVPQPLRDNLLNHSLDDAIVAYRTWSSVANTEHFRSRICVLDLTVIVVLVLTSIVAGMFTLEYYHTGVMPTYEKLSVAFMPLAVILVVQYCLNDSYLMAMVAKALYNRYKL